MYSLHETPKKSRSHPPCSCHGLRGGHSPRRSGSTCPSVIYHIGVIVLPRTEDDTSHKTGSINIGHLEGAVTGWCWLVWWCSAWKRKGLSRASSLYSCQSIIVKILPCKPVTRPSGGFLHVESDPARSIEGDGQLRGCSPDCRASEVSRSWVGP